MSLSQFVVFDHDHSKLQKYAELSQFVRLPVTETGNAKDEQAKYLLLADSNWTIAFVHINPGPWDELCSNAPENKVLVRFSTDGYPPTPPKGSKALCIHCCLKIRDIKQPDLEVLKDVLTKENGLMDGFIPQRIRHLISFKEPHLLQSLHILMQGVLAFWASNPDSAFSQRSRECLGITSIPPLLNGEICKRSTIWKALGLGTDVIYLYPRVVNNFLESLEQEIGGDGLVKMTKLNNLIKSICVGRAEECLDELIVIEGFKSLNELLKK